MSISNYERVQKALEILRQGLAPYVEREIRAALKAGALEMDNLRKYAGDPILSRKPVQEWDVSGLLKLMWESWNEAFRKTLGNAQRSLVSELREWRNKWAHQEAISSDDADRALDSMSRLLSAISAPEADIIQKMKQELRREIYGQQVRDEKKKWGGSLLSAAASGALKPWREIVTPHADVSGGNFQNAEFAADLWQVHIKEGSPEYRDPVEFFRRTYLTDSLKKLLVNALLRLSGRGGDPVVQLQTNFGGGKTHSMLALYHLFSGESITRLPGIEEALEEAGLKAPVPVRRVVLVGNKISPGNPVKKPGGVEVRTLWGELAWQLGGAEAFAVIEADDRNATSPGDRLRELFITYGPCLILIDEWVAYARQLHDGGELPGGPFETMFSFAQSLTESARLVKNCLLVISLPASDGQETGLAGGGNDIEVGGLRGRESLERLRNVLGRLDASWRPATAEESFEIVRRRLFQSLSGPEAHKQRDITVQAFADLYQHQAGEFPPECSNLDYKRRLSAAFPIHPEVFDQLYGGWSTLVKFQRTRGVLRLMAAVIHSLWKQGDRTPLIMPASIPIADAQVQYELTRYLSDNWTPIIHGDVDGEQSVPVRTDGIQGNLGKYNASRRVARVIYLGSAPIADVTQRGVEDRRIKLGCVFPGEPPSIFGDALRRLASAAAHLYQDGNRYWFATQPTVAKVAEDRAEQLRREPDKIAAELDRRLRNNLKEAGLFSRVYPQPRNSADIGDDDQARLVVLPADQPYSGSLGDPGDPALKLAAHMLETRGSAPRLYRNTLIFLAADKARLQDLEGALRRFLAWDSICDEKDKIDLTHHQAKQAESQRKDADGEVMARLPETYRWLMVPEQTTPHSKMSFRVLGLSGEGSLAARALRKLKDEELLLSGFSPGVLRREMDKTPLWRNGHVSIRQLADDFSRYIYLPRLLGPETLAETIRRGLSAPGWRQETFAYADEYDEVKGRYSGLRGGEALKIEAGSSGLLVRPETAVQQMEAEAAYSGVAAASYVQAPELSGEGVRGREAAVADSKPPEAAKKTRFFGTVELNVDRVGRDAGAIGEEIISHLSSQPGAVVTVTLEINAHLPDGAAERLMRTVNENSRTLKFKGFGFEDEK